MTKNNERRSIFELKYGNFMEQWLLNKERTTAPSTSDNYRRIYENHIKEHMAELNVSTLRVEAIKTVLDSAYKKNLSGRTLSLIKFVLKTTTTDLHDAGLCLYDLSHAFPKSNPRTRFYQMLQPESFFTKEELELFFQAASGEHLRDAFWVAVNTGLRPGEWMGLPWDCVFPENKTIRVRQALKETNGKLYLGPPKTLKSWRTLSVSDSVLDAFERQREFQAKLAAKGWVNEHNLVFVGPKGHILRRTNVLCRDFSRILKQAGLKHRTLHSLRHTHASILIYQGVDIRTVSERLGHESVTTTLQTYSHLLPGQDARAAQLMEEFLLT